MISVRGSGSSKDNTNNETDNNGATKQAGVTAKDRTSSLHDDVENPVSW